MSVLRQRRFSLATGLLPSTGYQSRSGRGVGGGVEQDTG